jgi:hypothetical protein
LWNGADPILIIIDIVNVISFIILTPISIQITLNRNMVEEIHWIMKYFIIDSDEELILLEFIRGMNEISESSIPIHIEIQLFEQIVIITPIIIVFVKVNFVELINIRKKKIVSILRVWT